MKRIFTILTTVLLSTILWAQSPEKISYQAVVRDASNNPVANQSVGMQISILQDTESGTTVYTETQTPTTNANGLVSIEIGAGTTSDDFSAIDWANGPYFIKTETDPTGGTSYTITGTSQLLSVPYALHAKTAETVTGGIAEADPVYATDSAAILAGIASWNTSIAKGISTADTTNWNNKVDTLIAGAGIAISGNTIKATGGVSITTYSVGDFAQGGIVFYVDETGQHGLICAKEDQNGGNGIRWYAGTSGVTRATGDGLFTGQLNTPIIISSQISIGDDGNAYAAQICNDLQITDGGVTYGDWYLPSKYELNLMYTNKTTINSTAGANGGFSFASADYWSSTEDNNNNAWNQAFSDGSQNNSSKNGALKVRAIRAF